jgi:hypothetical protein
VYRITLHSSDFLLRMMSHHKYIVEVRNIDGSLVLSSDLEKKRQEYPYLFSKEEFTIDELCYYASFGQKRNFPIGPVGLPKFMQDIGISYRLKTW